MTPADLPEHAAAHAHPGPGVAVLACRCGAALDLTDMHHQDPAPGLTSGPTVRRIVCKDCR